MVAASRQAAPYHVNGHIPLGNLRPVQEREPREPEEAWKTVVLNLWRRLCPGCFAIGAEKAGVRYSFADRDGMSWSDRPAPKTRPRRW
jgi:hypothetical protein